MQHGFVHHSIEPRPTAVPESTSTTLRFRPGEALCLTSDPVDTLHRVLSGHLKLVRATEDGNERIVSVLGAGDVVGATVLMHGARHGVDAVAITEVRTRPSSRDEVLRSIQRSPEAAADLTGALAAQLLAAWSQLEEVYLPVRCRLARALLGLADRYAVPSPDDMRTLRSRLSHDDLAAMIGAQRVSVSNAMAELRYEGVIEGARGVYRIDAAGLAAIAYGGEGSRRTPRTPSTAVERGVARVAVTASASFVG